MKKIISRAVVVAAMVAASLLSPVAAGGHEQRRATLPALAPAPRDGLTRALEKGRLSEAEYSLARARSLFHRPSVQRDFRHVARLDPRAATLVLRDLAVRRNDLVGSDRVSANVLLARPTDGNGDPFGDGYKVGEAAPVCTADVCIHYVTSTRDAPDNTDANGNGVPDFVDTASRVLQDDVWAHEVDVLGYRPPKDDSSSPNNGGGRKLDVYLADIGDDGFYGYCTSDDPNLERSADGRRDATDVSAYCVLDDDFSRTQFPRGASGVEALEVTAAHEFFHAVQFAYDFFEDAWMLESSSVWMEDEVYDAIDDNLQYVPAGALGRPHSPLDSGKLTQLNMYGNFVWWRFLSERLGADFVLGVWRRADNSGSASFGNMYSIEAVASALASVGKSFRSKFSDFGVANLSPERSYEEGASYRARVPDGVVVTRSFALGRSDRSTGARTTKLDHLANRYVVIKRASPGFQGGRLRVTVDGPRDAAGPRASLVSFDDGGVPTARTIPLDSSGAGSATVGFGGDVAKVVVVLTNASTRYHCGNQRSFFAPPFACAGRNLFDDASFDYRARLTH